MPPVINKLPMLYKAKVSVMFGGKPFSRDKTYELTENELRSIGRYFEQVKDNHLEKAVEPKEEKQKKESPKKQEKKEEATEPDDESEEEVEGEKPKAKRK
jgi:hypothetical protein